MKDIKIIAFDADDTLWVNEPHFQTNNFRKQWELLHCGTPANLTFSINYNTTQLCLTSNQEIQNTG